MKTTINIDDRLLAEIQELAAKNQTSVSSIIEDALRQAVAANKQPAGRNKIRLARVKGKGLRRAVDLEDAASLLEFMECSDRIH